MDELIAWLSDETNLSFDSGSYRRAAGGCIHDSFVVEARDGTRLFLKTNRAEAIAIFEAECAGLLQLCKAGTSLLIPRPIATTVIGNQAALAMDWLDLGGSLNQAGESLGHGLADLHRATSESEAFGNDFDNHIGATEQRNRWMASWADFFVQQRLEFQFQLAAKNGFHFSRLDSCLAKVHDHLDRLSIAPALIHGDLWSGNAAATASGEPAIFDPAAYYADREAEIAFTHFFGGFPNRFYEAYREVHPAPADEPIRHRIYNLYHVVNHANLFGGGYATQASSMLESIERDLC
ncbi:MAG: fructosamine kinase family protein [Verrucomicrobiota bacterium]